MPYDVATLQRKYKVKLPPRVKELIKHELASYEGATLAKPLDDIQRDFTIVVVGNEILFDRDAFFDRTYRPGRIPLAALANDRGHYRAEVVMVHCATGGIDFGRGADHGDDDPPKLQRIAKDLDGFLKMLKRRSH
jgi:hypothetical protein